MKILISLFILIPGIAVAAGYGGTEGINKAGEIVGIGGDTADTIYVRKRVSSDLLKRTFFSAPVRGSILQGLPAK